MINLVKILVVIALGYGASNEMFSDCIAEDASVVDLACDGTEVTGIYSFSHITFNATEEFSLFVETDPPTLLNSIDSKGGDHELSFTFPASSIEGGTSLYLECSDYLVDDSKIEIELPECK